MKPYNFVWNKIMLQFCLWQFYTLNTGGGGGKYGANQNNSDFFLLLAIVILYNICKLHYFYHIFYESLLG